MNVLAKNIVVDASLILDLYAAPDEERASIAEEVTGWIMRGLVEAYAPKLLVVEVVGVLSRYLSEKDLDRVLASLPPIRLVPEGTIYEEVLQIVRKTGSRAIDGYYIAVASVVNGVLLTNDRTQSQNARRADLRAYYLIKELEDTKRELDIHNY